MHERRGIDAKIIDVRDEELWMPPVNKQATSSNMGARTEPRFGPSSLHSTPATVLAGLNGSFSVKATSCSAEQWNAAVALWQCEVRSEARRRRAHASISADALGGPCEGRPRPRALCMRERVRRGARATRREGITLGLRRRSAAFPTEERTESAEDRLGGAEIRDRNALSKRMTCRRRFRHSHQVAVILT